VIQSQFERRQRAQQAAAVVGIDAGKEKHALTVRPRGGVDAKPLEFPVTRPGFEAAVAYIERHAPGAAPADVLIGIECAGNYGFTLAHYLRERGYRLVSVLPRDTKRWKDVVHGGPNKTDKLDARTIADLTAQGKFVAFPFLKQEFADLRYLSSARMTLVRRRTGTLNRIRGILQVVWPEFEGLANFNRKTYPALLRAYPGPGDFLAAPKAEVLALLRKVSRGHAGEKDYQKFAEGARTTLALPIAQGVHKAELPLLLDRLMLDDEQLAVIEARMLVVLRTLPEWTYLKTIPKVGEVTAATFLGGIGDPQAYSSVKEVLKIAGLSLVKSASGKRTGPDRLSKRGRPALRQMAYMFAVRNIKGSAAANPWRARYEAYVARHEGLGKKGLVVLMRELVKIMFCVAKERRPYTAEHPAPRRRAGAAALPEAAPVAPPAPAPAPAPARETVAAEPAGYDRPARTASRERRARKRSEAA
jgi:transposase